jgi:uncharacterized protein (TIGR03086 family)
MTDFVPSDPHGQLARALHATEGLVAGVQPGQWTAATGCPGWSVRDLLNHLVGGNGGLASALHEQAPHDDGDHLGDDPMTSYRRSGEALLAAFAEPDVFDKMVTVPAGTVPSAVALHLRLTELLVHGWDLATATGQPTAGLPEDLAEQELAFSRVQLKKMPPDRRPFAPPQPVQEDAPAIDRLAALLGRSRDGDAPGPR